MPRDRRRVDRALQSKGFQRDEDGSHVAFAYVTQDGRRSVVRTHISHGRDRDISDDLLAKMARQCRLTRPQFDRLVDCPMERREYEELLRGTGVLE
jgi:predicted RNA binding protein YcfA (HicA-like mRNA interferase family)